MLFAPIFFEKKKSSKFGAHIEICFYIPKNIVGIYNIIGKPSFVFFIY